MARALSYQAARPELTFHDCLAVTLAAANDWPLLTGDKRMRALAEAERIEVHGVLWIIDRFAKQGVVSDVTLAAALRGMLEDPRTHMPHAEIRRRLEAFVAKLGG
jgi:hypothetical protein